MSLSSLRLLPRRPSRALAEAMGAAAGCPHGPCGVLRPSWPVLAGALASEAPEPVIHGQVGAAVHATRCCHLDCPAVAGLRDVSALLNADHARDDRIITAA